MVTMATHVTAQAQALVLDIVDQQRDQRGADHETERDDGGDVEPRSKPPRSCSVATNTTRRDRLRALGW